MRIKEYITEYKKQFAIVGVMVALIIILSIIVIIKENKSKNVLELTDENLFFSLQMAVNNYLIDVDDTLSYLDQKFIDENDINSYNINNKIKIDYNFPSFTMLDAYYKKEGLMNYYFVSGYLYDTTVGNNYNYYDNLHFLISVNGNTYRIRPLEDVEDDYIDYYNDYDVDSINVTTGIYLEDSSITETIKLEIYLSNYVNLLSLDANKAKKYGSIYNISTNINSYSKSEEDGYILYTIYDSDNRKIELKEYSIMNYYID